MTKFRSNLNSINNNALLFARHNDTHSNDALQTLLTNIYTAAPESVIVETGVNYRSATSDFQAWAIYFNPMQIFNPAAPNKFELVSQLQDFNYYAYTGTFEIFNDTQLGVTTPGDYFCLTSVDYQATGVFDVILSGLSSLEGVLNDIAVNNYNLTGSPKITIVWELSGGLYFTTFDTLPGHGAQYMAVSSNVPLDLIVLLWKGGGTITGDAIPAHGTTGRFGILLNQYTIS
jgi:hypothetical protein